jgi:transcription elongation factor GreA
MEEQIITQDGYDKLKEELEYLKNVKRREIANRIQKAKDMGDLSENAEYSEAKDAQAFNDGRIAELMAMVTMGSVVLVNADGKEREFVIVSFNEADPANGKISNESPLGRAFIGKKKGAIVMVQTPKGTKQYRIEEIR